MKAALVAFAAGCLGGCLFGAALLIFNIGGLGMLVTRDPAVTLPLLLLLANLAGLFGTATAISSFMGEDRPRGHPLRVKALPVARPLRSPHR